MKSEPIGSTGLADVIINVILCITQPLALPSLGQCAF